jgi:hypothetical protein
VSTSAAVRECSAQDAAKKPAVMPLRFCDGAWPSVRSLAARTAMRYCAHGAGSRRRASPALGRITWRFHAQVFFPGGENVGLFFNDSGEDFIAEDLHRQAVIFSRPGASTELGE